MSDKFNQAIVNGAKSFELYLYEQEQPAGVADAAADQQVEPPVPGDEPEAQGQPDDTDIDSQSLSVNLVELARKALLVDPQTIDQSSLGKLTQVVTMDNADEISDIIGDIVSMQSTVDAEPVVDYNNII